MLHKASHKRYEFFDRTICSWLISYLLIVDYNRYINQNKRKIRKKIVSYKSQPNILKNIIIESKIKKEAIENSIKILTSISTAFYVLLLQSILTIYIFYVNNLNNYAINLVFTILNSFPKLQQNIDYKRYNEFLNVAKNSLITFNDATYKVVIILIICFLGLIFISLFFLYIEATRKNYLIEYSKKFLK